MSGHLFDSIGSGAGSDYVPAGTNKEYAGVHQSGFKEMNIAPRPYPGLSPDDINDLPELIDVYLSKHIGG